MRSTASINLLKSRVNLLDESLKWALTVGRLLIIIVEFVAFSTFVLRFSLDRTLIDLHDKISQEQAIVASLKDRENTYRSLQETLSVASGINNQGSKSLKVFQDIAAFTPSEIRYTSFSIHDDQVLIQAKVRSAAALAAFLDSLRSYPDISSATIDALGNQTNDGSLTVTITVTLKHSVGGI